MNITNYSDINREDPSLRPYQQKAKKEIFESWDEVDSVMFQMPTGTGKTRLFTSIISDVNKYSIQRREAVKILIIAHRTELIDQIDKSLEKYKVPHNVIVGGREKNYKFPVSVASIQTITNKRNLKDAKKLKIQFIIIDEAHHALASSYKKLWNLYPDAKRLGVTATPWRMNHQSFTDLFDKLILSMPVKEFIRQGYLAPYKYFSLKNDSDIQRTIDDIELDRFGEYKESSMEEKMDIGSIRAQLLESYLSLAEGKKGIIYAINIAHAKHICEEYKNAGYRTVCIDSKTPDGERKELVSKFKKGIIDIIVNVDIFSEGFDCPDIEFIQLARPTCSLVKYLQQVGRGLRITENKQNCVILDNVGMYAKFGLPDARRHWKYHFLGKYVEEEPVRVVSKGTGKSRYVDISEGTEDMELIQDVSGDVEVNIAPNKSNISSAIEEFFPIYGVVLGETTWKDVENMGYVVEVWKEGPRRYSIIENVAFWDHEGKGVFTSIYWVNDYSGQGFPDIWKSKGFFWDNSYNKWQDVFEDMGFSITLICPPLLKEYKGRKTLSAEFCAYSPDKTLSFNMNFNYGEKGYSTSSPNTLYSITVKVDDSLLSLNKDESSGDEIVSDSVGDAESVIDVKSNDESYVDEPFDPMPKLLENNYENDNFVFLLADDEHVYESYIQNDTFYIISELIIDESHHCVHRKRVGKISMSSWMFEQMEKMKVDHLKSIRHFGANYTVFDYEDIQSSVNEKHRYFDYKGREINSPSVVKVKYEDARKEGTIQDYMDVPVTKASFRVEFLIKQIYIYRTCRNVTKPIAQFLLNSDFGKRYYGLSSQHIKVNKKRRYKESDQIKLRNFRNDNCNIVCSGDMTFTTIWKDTDKVVLCKYDFMGNSVYEETIAEKKVTNDSTGEDDDFSKLWHVFDSKATTYKYFWFLSIMELYVGNNQTVIPFKNIISRMISNAWPYLNKENVEFPKIDQLPKYLSIVIDRTPLENSSGRKMVEDVILEFYNKAGLESTLSPLLKNVPYRFLSPWIPFTSNEEVIAKSNEKGARCPYSLQDDHITINPIWRDYLLKNYYEIISFIEKELLSFLKSK